MNNFLKKLNNYKFPAIIEGNLEVNFPKIYGQMKSRDGKSQRVEERR